MKRACFFTITLLISFLFFLPVANATYPGMSLSHWDPTLSNEYKDPDYQTIAGLVKEKKYDVIIMDMTDPFGPSRKLYTLEFFNKIKSILKNMFSVFVMHTESPISRPLAFGSIQATLNKSFKQVNTMYPYIQM